MILNALGKRLYTRMEVKDALKRGDVIVYDKFQESVAFLRFNNKINSWERLSIANMMSLYFPLNDMGGHPASDFRKNLRFRQFVRFVADLSGFQDIERVDPMSLRENRYIFAFRLV